MAIARNRHRDSRGAAAVEMALLLPILITLLFGAIDFGLVLFSEIQVSQAAQAGARALAINPDASVDGKVSGASPGLDAERLSWTSTPCDGTKASVTVTYAFDAPVPFPFVPATLTQTAATPCTAS